MLKRQHLPKSAIYSSTNIAGINSYNIIMDHYVKALTKLDLEPTKVLKKEGDLVTLECQNGSQVSVMEKKMENDSRNLMVRGLVCTLYMIL